MTFNITNGIGAAGSIPTALPAGVTGSETTRAPGSAPSLSPAAPIDARIASTVRETPQFDANLTAWSENIRKMTADQEAENIRKYGAANNAARKAAFRQGLPSHWRALLEDRDGPAVAPAGATYDADLDPELTQALAQSRIDEENRIKAEEAAMEKQAIALSLALGNPETPSATPSIAPPGGPAIS